MRLAEVTRTDLQDLVDGLVAEGLSATTVGVDSASAQGDLQARDAAARSLSIRQSGLRFRRSAVGATGSRRRRSARSCSRRCRARDRPLWATAMYAGLRRGELMALRLEDVDLAAGVIHVRRGWDAKEGEIATKSSTRAQGTDPEVLRDISTTHLLSLGRREGLVFGTTRPSAFLRSAPLTERAGRRWKRQRCSGSRCTSAATRSRR